MANIQFVNTLTDKQWEAVCQDSRFDKNYGKAAGNQRELARELIDRVEKICKQIHIIPPTKVVVTYDMSSELQVSSEELRIHPFTFAACKLDKDHMSWEHQEFYKDLKSIDVRVLVNQRLQIPISIRNLLLQHKPKLNENLKRYEYIIPSNELDHRMMTLMDSVGKLCSNSTRTVVEGLLKISCVSAPIFTGIALWWVTNKFTPDDLYWPLVSSLGVLTAKWSWQALKKSETFIPFIIKLAFKYLNHESLKKSWDRLSPEAQFFSIKYQIADNKFW